MSVNRSEGSTLHRTIVAGLVWNRRGQLLLCQMSPHRGVFPGQWGIPGGGLESGESMEVALRRELREEIGVEIDDICPAFFKDGLHQKVFADGSRRSVYMIFLLFHCTARQEALRLDEEHVDYRWVNEGEIGGMDLNTETVDTLKRLGPWSGVRHAVRKETV